MTPWHELEVGRLRIRWRKKEGEFAHFAAGYEIEKWSGSAREWRPVENWSSRDWFVLGFHAAKQLAEGEQGRLL